MTSDEARLNSERAWRIYDERLRAALEANHHGRFVAIEPESGDYFLGDTLDAAADAAQVAHTARRSHVLRVGYRAALFIGGAYL